MHPLRLPCLQTLLPRGTVCLALLQGSLVWAQSDRSALPPGTESAGAVTVTAPALPYRQFDRVEITGSSIIRKEQTQTLPVQVVTRAEIQRSGKNTTAELVQALPAVFNSFSPAMLGATQAGFSGAAIHGLQTGTLVLVNGRRLAGNGRQTGAGADNGGIDLNWLPLSAIDRIEVLTDGASSVYGTDAQTGVINIITRAERPGVEITADYRMPDGNKGQSKRVDLSAGGGRLAQDGYSWLVTFDALDQQELLGRDRPWASAGRYLVQKDGKDYWVYGPSLQAAQTSPTLSSTSTGANARLWNADYQNGQCPPNKVIAYGQSACLDNGYMGKGLYPASSAVRLHTQGQLMLDADTTAYAELSLQNNDQRRTYTNWGAYSAKIANTPGAPGYDLAVAQGFDPARGTWLLYSGSELGSLSRWYRVDTRRLVLGLKGQWQDWNYNGGYYFSDSSASLESDVFAAYPNLGKDSSGVLNNTALLSPLWDNTAQAQQLRQTLQGMVIPRVMANQGTNRMQGVDLKASRSIGELDGKDILLALGMDWRHETANYDKTLASSNAVPSYSGQRTVWAQFAELQLPLPGNVETLASLRNDHYSVFGNTTHGKLAAKWAPNPQWMIRGAWGTSFRAPAIAQMQETEKTRLSGFAYNCTESLRAVAQTLGGACPANNQYGVYSQGSSQLKPESSTQQSLGLRFSPSRNNSFSVDYWRIDMRDKISYVNPDLVLANPQKYLQNFELNANRQLQIYAPMVNLGRTQMSGVDFSWAYRNPTEWGMLTLGVSGTRLLTSKYQTADGEPFVSDLNTYSGYYSSVVPRLRTRWHAGLAQGGWQWWAAANHVGSHDDGAGAGMNITQVDTGQVSTLTSHAVPAWWTLDLTAMYQWSPKTSIRVMVENVFNRQAPLDLAMTSSFNFGTNPLLANVWGRTVNLSFTHRF